MRCMSSQLIFERKYQHRDCHHASCKDWISIEMICRRSMMRFLCHDRIKNCNFFSNYWTWVSMLGMFSTVPCLSMIRSIRNCWHIICHSSFGWLSRIAWIAMCRLRRTWKFSFLKPNSFSTWFTIVSLVSYFFGSSWKPIIRRTSGSLRNSCPIWMNWSITGQARRFSSTSSSTSFDNRSNRFTTSAFFSINSSCYKPKATNLFCIMV